MGLSQLPSFPTAANPPAVRVTHNTTQSITHATVQAVVFNTETYDTDGIHSTAINNSRLTIVSPGLYIISYSVPFASANDYTRVYGDIRLNGTTVSIGGVMDIQSPATSNLTKTVAGTTTYKLSAGDFVQLCVFHQNGALAARNLIADSDSAPCTLSAVWVGRGV